MPCLTRQTIETLTYVVRWIQSWATLVTAVSAYTASKSHLILDFIDYPDKAGLKWEANNGLPGSGMSPSHPMVLPASLAAQVRVNCIDKNSCKSASANAF